MRLINTLDTPSYLHTLTAAHVVAAYNAAVRITLPTSFITGPLLILFIILIVLILI